MKPFLRAEDNGYWYKLGSLIGWRKGNKPEVEEYVNKLMKKINKRRSSSLSWRQITRARCCAIFKREE